MATTYWSAEGEKRATRAKALAAFAASEEAVNRRAIPLVNALIFVAFGRAASEKELASHVQQIRSEISLEVLVKKLVNSLNSIRGTEQAGQLTPNISGLCIEMASDANLIRSSWQIG
jgi:hypothetical protein